MLVIADLFSKLARFLPLWTTTATVILNAFLDHWMYAYGAPAHVLTDNGRQFVARYLDAVCAIVGAKNYLTAAYHPPTRSQTERFNATIVQRLRRYIEEHQRDLYIYLQPFTYAYSLQVHHLAETTPFALVFTRHPSGLVTTEVSFQGKDTAGEEHMEPVQYKRATPRRLRNVLTHARSKLSAVQKRYKRDFDRQVSFRPVINAKDFVYINRPLLAVTEVERRDPERLDENSTDDS